MQDANCPAKMQNVAAEMSVQNTRQYYCELESLTTSKTSQK